MNWKEIQKKYPKALGLFEKWFRDGFIPGIDDIWYDGQNAYFCSEYWKYEDEAINTRELYDFFDEQKIIITTYFIWGGGFRYAINDGGANDGGYYSEWIKSRTEAEEAAFTKAFEILEEKLK